MTDVNDALVTAKHRTSIWRRWDRWFVVLCDECAWHARVDTRSGAIEVADRHEAQNAPLAEKQE